MKQPMKELMFSRESLSNAMNFAEIQSKKMSQISTAIQCLNHQDRHSQMD